MHFAGVSRHGRIVSVGCATTAACHLLFMAPAFAQTPAHLSDDLSSSLSQSTGSRQTMRVIVHGSADEVAGIASRHGVRIKWLMSSGAVLEADAAGLESLRSDWLVDHISGDLPISSGASFDRGGPVRQPQRLANTLSTASGQAAYRIPNTEFDRSSQQPQALPNLLDEVIRTIGADKVWRGTSERRGATGKGVGIAIIDSGVWARHPALKGHIVATADFTDEGRRQGRTCTGTGRTWRASSRATPRALPVWRPRRIW